MLRWLHGTIQKWKKRTKSMCWDWQHCQNREDTEEDKVRDTDKRSMT